jgi:hypothetical protein
MVKDWLKEEGVTTEYLDDEETDVNCAVIKDNVLLNISFLKAAKDSLIVSGKVGIQPNQEDEVQNPTKLMKESLYDLEIVILQMNLDFTIDDPIVIGMSFQYLTYRSTKHCFLTVCQKTGFLKQWH